MLSLTRRRMFTSLSAGLLAAAVSGCATTREAGSLKVILNVEKIDAYIQASSKAAVTVISIVELVPALASYVPNLKDVVEKLSVASDTFNQATKGQLVVDYNSDSVHTIIDSLFALFKQLAVIFKNVVVGLGAQNLSVSMDTVKRVEVLYNSLSTLVSILRITLMPSTASVMNDPAKQRIETLVLRTLSA